MLQQKQKEVPYISVFKTNSGEEFIGKVVSETMLAYTINKPLCMVDTGQGLRFAPFLMMADMEGVVSVPKPIINAEPNAALANQYESAVSGIALPQKQGIIS